MSARVHDLLTLPVYLLTLRLYVAPVFRPARRAARCARSILIALALLGWATMPADAQETIEYYGIDHLGSVRVVFDPAGNVLSRADYLPYGEEVFAPTGQMPAQQFTGQARDGEAGQD